MKVSFHFQVLAALYICNFVCGSEESGIAPSMDYPYIMHNVDKMTDGWENVVIRLSFLKDSEIDKLLVEYENVVHTKNQNVGDFLYKMVIQHCISRNFMRNLDLKIEDENDNRVALLRTAVKLQLEVSKSRISHEKFDLKMEEENKFKLKRIDSVLNLKELSGDYESNALPVMREQMKYVSHTIAMEYIYLSMAGSRTSTFLIKLFKLMDANLKSAEGFVYYDGILLFDPPSNFRIDAYDEEKHGNNFIREFYKPLTTLMDDYLEKKHVRNKQQMYFQNQMIKNHFYLTRHNKTYMGSNVNLVAISKEAVALKIENFKQQLNSLTTNIFQYKDNKDDSSLSLDEPISLVDFVNDQTFKELKRSFGQLSSSEKDTLEKALLMWIEEKLVMSIIADDDMFLALNRLFQYLDRTREKASLLGKQTSFKDIMHIKNEFIPVFLL